MKTAFSFEVPLKHLNDFDEDQDYYFTLSMLYDHSKYYYYINRASKKGLKTIWIDNSFNELFEAEAPTKLMHLAKTFDASKVIAPDSIHWPTKDIFDNWLAVRNSLGAHKAVCVVGSYKMLIELSNNTDFNPWTVAVSYWKRPNGEHPGWSYDELKKIYNTIPGLKKIYNTIPGVTLHFLGLNSVEELQVVQPESCDTSMPVKLAIKNMTLRQWVEQGCPHIHTKDLGPQGSEFFNMTLSTKTIDLAKQNIYWLKRLATYETSQS